MMSERERQLHLWAQCSGKDVTWCTPGIWLLVLKERTQQLTAFLKLVFDTMNRISTGIAPILYKIIIPAVAKKKKSPV